MRIMKAALASMLLLAPIGCVDDEAVEDIVEVKKGAKKSAHEFTVTKDGTVKFDAEIVYFNFDDHTLTEEGKTRLQALNTYLTKNSDKKLQISGHCDERGSIEYNLALGQMRAKTVKQYLTHLGLDNKRIHSISYGEEKPAVEGHSEPAWKQNRRAEFVLSSFSE